MKRYLVNGCGNSIRWAEKRSKSRDQTSISALPPTTICSYFGLSIFHSSQIAMSSTPLSDTCLYDGLCETFHARFLHSTSLKCSPPFFRESGRIFRSVDSPAWDPCLPLPCHGFVCSSARTLPLRSHRYRLIRYGMDLHDFAVRRALNHCSLLLDRCAQGCTGLGVRQASAKAPCSAFRLTWKARFSILTVAHHNSHGCHTAAVSRIRSDSSASVVGVCSKHHTRLILQI